VIQVPQIEEPDNGSNKRDSTRTARPSNLTLGEIYPFGLRLVKEQGWKQGTGLGSAKNPGSLEPVQPTDHPKGAGIGYKKAAKPQETSCEPEQDELEPEKEYVRYVRKRFACPLGCIDSSTAGIELTKTATHWNLLP